MDRLQCDCLNCGIEATIECLNSDHDPIFCPFCGEKLADQVEYEDDEEDSWDDPWCRP